MIRCVLLLLLAFAWTEGQSATPSVCNENEFQCFDGQCILKSQWCDRKFNCRDKSDEGFCRKGIKDPNNCKPQTLLFLCKDGTCIPKVGRCDRFSQCPDNSDEENCPSSSKINNKVLPESAKDQITQNRPLHNYRYIVNSSAYRDLPYNSYRSQLSLARDWLKSQQRKDFGWGDSTARAVISMYLSREAEFPVSEDTGDYMLMDKQLDIELFIALTRNETSTMTLSELSLYINSLLAACKNPRNFYGYDLVNILRSRAYKVYSSTKFVSPLVHLTLCLSNATDHLDLLSLQDMFNRDKNRHSFNRVDILSLAVLASSCMIKNPKFSHSLYRENFVKQLLEKLKTSGLPGNIYELSLAMQALNEAKVDPQEWGRSEAIEFILRMQDDNGSFGDILATYYTIPILTGKSLLFLSDHCSKDFSNGKTPLAVLKNIKKSKISVHYSLLFGDPVEMSQRIQLPVAQGTNFLDVMRLAEEENPNFRFNLDETKAVPFVYSIGGIPNDAERGLYWTLHVQDPRNPKNFVPFGNDIKILVPSDGEEIRFWLKQM